MFRALDRCLAVGATFRPSKIEKAHFTPNADLQQTSTAGIKTGSNRGMGLIEIDVMMKTRMNENV